MRASRFFHRQDSRRYVASKVALRCLLSAYTDVEPSRFSFQTGPFGKPALSESVIKFSVSHSVNLTLIAIAVENEIGVDLERVGATLPDSIAQVILSRNEVQELSTLEQRERSSELYRVWTRKEAVLKAAGTGIQVDPRLVEVVAGDVVNLPSGASPISWGVLSFIPRTSFVAALCGEAAWMSSVRYELRDWMP